MFMWTQLLRVTKGAGRQRRLFGLVLAVAISGCGGGSSSSPDAASSSSSSGTTSTPAGATDESALPNFAELQWGANGEPDLSGYRVYYGTSPGEYQQSFGQGINAGNQTSYLVSGLASGQRYYFVITAYDTSGNESGYSNEVHKDIP